MGYAEISNLYKNQDILLFKECYALEKIHGTSAHIAYEDDGGGGQRRITYFSGGEKHENFVALFDEEALMKAFLEIGATKVKVHGEAYGGKQQGMKATYGDKLKFIVFDVKIGEHSWLSVPQAEEVAKTLGLEFVHYVKIPTTLEAIDAERDADSVQAVRNGITEPRKREGVVLRPLISVRKNNGERIVAKHKREDFSERKTKQKVTDKDKLKVLQEAKEIADEWVTPMRLTHVLDQVQSEINAAGDQREIGIEDMGTIIKAMIADVLKESTDEIVDSKAARTAIGRKAAGLYKERLKGGLKHA